MSSLQRFFAPTVRIFDANIKSLPGALLYFYRANSSTLKATYQDKAGNIAHTNPVVADSTGTFAPIFLSGLYRVELRSAAGVVQNGYPIDNVGQDTVISPFAPWSEIVTYQTDDVVTSPTGDWYRSLVDNNLGDDPDAASGDWALIVIPVSSNFISNVAWLTFADSANKISANIATQHAGFVGAISQYSADTGASDAYVMTLSPAITAYVTGAEYRFIAGATNTTASTLNINGVAATAIRKNGTTALVAGDIVAGEVVRVVYDGTFFQLQSYLRSEAAGTAATANVTTSPTDSTSGRVWRVDDLPVTTTTVELGGNYTAGEEVKCQRVGNTVTITGIGSLGHSSSSAPASAAGAIPAAFRPTVASGDASAVYDVTTGGLFRVKVTASGSFQTVYYNTSFTLVARTDSGPGPTLSYVV